MGVKTYREEVNRVLRAKHADIEMGLAMAREQEAFIGSVARKLSQTSWAYHMHAGYNFEMAFVIETGKVALSHQKDAIKQHLKTAFDVADCLNYLVVSDKRKSEQSCIVQVRSE